MNVISYSNLDQAPACRWANRKLSTLLRLGIAASLLGALAAQGQTLQVIHSFDNTNGASPKASLILGTNGNFYGTTSAGGTNGSRGTIFTSTPNGGVTMLVSLKDTNGNCPLAGLAQGTDGNYYGTTEYGGNLGYGLVYQTTAEGILTVLASFANTNGLYPSAGVVQGPDGSFYGTTHNGGDYGLGTAFRITTGGVLTTLLSFNGTNGAYPGALALAPDGAFYGTTGAGGHSYGTVFRMAVDGTLSTLASFDYTNGSTPAAALVLGADGAFYGTTCNGGSSESYLNGDGTVFRVTTNGELKMLVSFNGSNGRWPQGALTPGANGGFYGTTQSGGSSFAGSVFKVTTNGILTVLALFDNGGAKHPMAGLTPGPDGNLYGTTSDGGTYGAGAIFRLNLSPLLQSPIGTNGVFSFHWAAIQGNTYQVQYTTSLSPSTWTDLGDPLTASGTVLSFTNSCDTGQQRLYRVVCFR